MSGGERPVSEAPGDPYRPTFNEHFDDTVVLLLLYGALGPPVGAIIVSVPIAIMGFHVEGIRVLMIVMLGVPCSYVFGAVPALACGIVAAWTTWRGHAISYVGIAATGAVATVLFGLYRDGFNALFGRHASEAALSYAMFGLVGALSALVCRRVGRRLHGPA